MFCEQLPKNIKSFKTHAFLIFSLEITVKEKSVKLADILAPFH